MSGAFDESSGTFDFPLSTGITLHHDTYPFISPTKFIGALTGKVVLVTGASRGIGRATAFSFAAAGASVAAIGRTATEVESLIAEIKSNNSAPAFAIVGDVLNDPKDVISRVEKALGPIDILVNNAGISRMARFAEETDLDAWWKVFELNIKAPTQLIHAVLPSFLSRPGTPKTIITVASSSADLPLPFLSAYCASKAGIVKAIQILDSELREKNIYNYVIHPGNIGSTSLTLSPEATVGKEMRDIMDMFKESGSMDDTAALPADSMVALAGLTFQDVEKVGVLSGRYWDVQDDLEEVLAKSDEIQKRSLYHLRVRRL